MLSLYVIINKKEMGFVKEFKEFAIKGNVIDLAVGVIIGAAFGKIVNSLVNDVVMPPIGKLLGGVNFNDLLFSLDGKDYESIAKAKQAGAPVIAYGSFIQTVLEFFIIAFAVFLMIKVINRLKRKEEKEPEAIVVATKEEVLLTEIRDLMRNQR